MLQLWRYIKHIHRVHHNFCTHASKAHAGFYFTTYPLLDLPSELTLELVATIPAQQVVALMRACSQLNALLSSDQLWRSLALRDLVVLRQLVD